MRKPVLLIAIVGSLLASTAAVYAQDYFARKRLRVTLHQCISSEYNCSLACAYGHALPPPWGGMTDLQYKECLNRCSANHAACVDLAFSSIARR